MEMPEIHYARNGDVAFPYQVLGDGPLGLVFSPGFINVSQTFAPGALPGRTNGRGKSVRRVAEVRCG